MTITCTVPSCCLRSLHPCIQIKDILPLRHVSLLLKCDEKPYTMMNHSQLARAAKRRPPVMPSTLCRWTDDPTQSWVPVDSGRRTDLHDGPRQSIIIHQRKVTPMSQVIDRCHNTAESHKNTKYLNVEPSHDQGYRLSRELRAASYLNHLLVPLKRSKLLYRSFLCKKGTSCTLPSS